MSADIPSSLRKRLVIFSLFLVLFIDGLGVSVVLPLFSDLFLTSHTSILRISTSTISRNIFYSLGLVSFSLGMFLGAPLLGDLSDAWGRKKVLILSLGGTVIGYVMSGLGVCIASPALFIGGRLLDGLTSGSIPVAQAAITDISSDRDKAGNLALVVFSVTAGYVVGPLLSEVLVKKMGCSLASPFFIVAVLSFLSLLLLYPMSETHKLKASQKIQIKAFLKIFRSLREMKELHGVMISFFLFQLAWTMYFQYLSIFLSQTPLQHHVGWVLSYIGGGMALAFCLLVRMLQHVITPFVGSMLSVMIIAASWGIQSLGTANLNLFCIISFSSGVGYALGYSFFLTLLSVRARPNFQGLVMGVAASLSALSAVSTAVLGFLLTCLNPLGPLVFSSMCIGSCLVWMFLIFLHEKG